MTEWKHIDLKDDIGLSVSQCGKLTFEMDVDGWNDEDFMDLESLATIAGTRNDTGAYTFTVSYLAKEYQVNPEVTVLVKIGIERLKNEMNDYFN